MSTNTPITPDVMTIPRKSVDGVLPNLIGMMRPDLANALAESERRPNKSKCARVKSGNGSTSKARVALMK